MKKAAISILVLIMLAAALVVGMSLTASAAEADADAAQNVKWSTDAATNFTATWAAPTNAATSYTVKLYYVKDSTTNEYVGQSSVNSNVFTCDLKKMVNDDVKARRTAGDNGADASYPGYFYTYTFTVTPANTTHPESPVAEARTFSRLYAPSNPRWNSTYAGTIMWSANALNTAANGVQYYVELYDDLNPARNKSIYIGANTSIDLISQGHISSPSTYSFRVYATSNDRLDSELSDHSASLAYPVPLQAPSNLYWCQNSDERNDISACGTIKWSTVDRAEGYSVKIYRILPKTHVEETDVVNEETHQKIKKTYLDGCVYELIKTIDSSRSEGAALSTRLPMTSDIISSSGIYTFSVTALGGSGTQGSSASGFDITQGQTITLNGVSVNNVIYTPSTKTEFDESDLTSLAAALTSGGGSAIIPSEIFFNFIQANTIAFDLDNNGTADADQSNSTIYLSIGDKRTIGTYIVSPDNATNVKIDWTAGTNATMFSYFSYDANHLTMTGAKAGTIQITATPSFSKASKTLTVIISQKPTKLTITGPNSFLTGSTSRKTLTLSVEPDGANKTSDFFIWTSSEPSIAKVENGTVIPMDTIPDGKPTGYATIRVQSRVDTAVYCDFPIAVSTTEIMPSELVISGNNTVPLKSTLKLSATLYNDNSDSTKRIFTYNKDVIWSSSDEKTATVDQNGLVTPRALGPCTIKATSAANNTVYNTLTVQVVPEAINITALSLSGSKTINVGDTTDITLTMTPTNATNRDVVWSCSGGGSITKKSELVYTLTGTSKGTATVYVYAKDIPSIRYEYIVTVNSATKDPETDVGKTELVSELKPVAGTGDKINDYTANIKEAVLNEAIDKVYTQAIPLKTTPYVRLKVPTAANATSMTTIIPYNSIYKMINYYGYKDKGHIVIETGIGIIDIPPNALRRMYELSNNRSDIEIHMTRIVNTNLNENQQRTAGTDKVFEYKIVSGGKEISYFSGYPITVCIPYTLTSAQSGKGAQVNYMDDYGNLSSMSTRYDYKTKTVCFDTTHLSLYIPYYYAAVAWSNPFTDVKSTAWYYDSVFYVVDRELMRGISTDRFVPASYTTRAMVVTILYRLAGSPNLDAEVKNTFVDVPEKKWYTDAVLWATDNELVKGYGKGYFGPNDKVTREQLAVMLHNYAKYVDITPKYGWDTPLGYSDAAKVSSWAKQGAMYCQITGIISGRSGKGTFDPKGIATRAELATMLLRMNDQMEDQLASESK